MANQKDRVIVIGNDFKLMTQFIEQVDVEIIGVYTCNERIVRPESEVDKNFISSMKERGVPYSFCRKDILTKKLYKYYTEILAKAHFNTVVLFDWDVPIPDQYNQLKIFVIGPEYKGN